jgi:hypothetical protein
MHLYQKRLKFLSTSNYNCLNKNKQHKEKFQVNKLLNKLKLGTENKLSNPVWMYMSKNMDLKMILDIFFSTTMFFKESLKIIHKCSFLPAIIFILINMVNIKFF